MASKGFGASFIKRLQQSGSDAAAPQAATKVSQFPAKAQPALIAHRPGRSPITFQTLFLKFIRLGLGAVVKPPTAAEELKSKVSAKLSKALAQKRKAEVQADPDDGKIYCYSYLRF